MLQGTPYPPSWVATRIESCVSVDDEEELGAAAPIQGSGMILFGACLHGAVEFTQAHLRGEVSRSYGRIRNSMARTDARYPVRI